MLPLVLLHFPKAAILNIIELLTCHNCAWIELSERILFPISNQTNEEIFDEQADDWRIVFEPEQTNRSLA
jgi:hypothetical protein